MVSANLLSADIGSDSSSGRGDGSSARVRRSCIDEERLREELPLWIPKKPDKRRKLFEEVKEPLLRGLGDSSSQGVSETGVTTDWEARDEASPNSVGLVTKSRSCVTESTLVRESCEWKLVDLDPLGRMISGTSSGECAGGVSNRGAE